MTKISQKEYLKKYLGVGKAPGDKKKKKKKAVGDRLQIIDDDTDVLISREIEEDISAANEDAPQIVAVIDERPPSLRIDEETKSNLWTPIGITEGFSKGIKTITLSTSFKLSRQINSGQSESKTSYKLQKTIRDYDNSRVRIKEERDFSPKRDRNAGITPPHVQRSDDYSPPTRDIKVERDITPPRRKNHSEKVNLSFRKTDTPDNSPIRKDDDNSPPRKIRRDDCSSSSRKPNTEYSPPRKRAQDQSPPRRKYKENSSQRKVKDRPSSSSRSNDDNTPPRRRDHDQSPPRRRHREDSSPQRKNKDRLGLGNQNDDISSPPSRRDRHQSPPRKRKYDEDNSPSRREDRREDISSPRRKTDDLSPPRKNNKGKDGISPPRNRRKEKNGSTKKRSSRWGDWSPEAPPKSPPVSDKMKKTLDGKTAGLQNAKDLVKETTLLKQREDDIFRNMSAEVSGRNAATVVRAKKTEQDPVEIARQLEKAKKTKEKYDRWGKGMKQVEEQSERIADQLHEMSKPLARYANDEDLERYLKEQEREGDPMLNYIRKKKRSKAVAAGVPEKPMYMGEFMPNRFGIRPGYRWDGVDRSNGYEKKWFQVQNAKKASQEDAFKWSTEDM